MVTHPLLAQQVFREEPLWEILAGGCLRPSRRPPSSLLFSWFDSPLIKFFLKVKERTRDDQIKIVREIAFFV